MAQARVRPAGLVSLEDPDARTVERFGGKAARLAELSQAGFAVPDALIAGPDAFAEMFDAAGISTVTAGWDGNEEELQEASRRLTGAVLGATLPPAVVDAGVAFIEATGPLAVRSSAAREDGLRRSGAGQHESVLGVSDRAGLEEAYRRVLASQFSPHALRYWRGPVAGRNEMALILQRMVEASVSGVVFTRDPVGTLPDSLVYEACWGLATAVVDGSGVAERAGIRRTTREVVYQDLIPDRAGLFFDRSTGAIEQRPGGAPGPVLTPEEVIVLVETATAVEDYFGMPMDVEWSYEHGELLVLQARPITALGGGR
jgi:phosphoenolpyruvate synthase/pyruvate phosphate dikinase